MPYYRKTITLPKELVLKHARAQIAMQLARDDGNYTPERAVEELINEALYYKAKLFTESARKDFETELCDNKSPEFLLFNTLESIFRSDPNLLNLLKALQNNSSSLYDALKNKSMFDLERVDAGSASVREKRELIPEGSSAPAIMQIAAQNDLNKELQHFAKSKHIRTDNNADTEDKGNLATGLATLLYYKEKREPYRHDIVLTNIKKDKATSAQIKNLILDLYKKIPHHVIEEIARRRIKRQLQIAYKDDIESRLNELEKIPHQITSDNSEVQISMNLCIPIDDIYDIVFADLAIRAGLKSELTGPVSRDNRCWIGLFPILNSESEKDSVKKTEYQTSIIEALQKCDHTKEIYISVLSRSSGTSSGHYILFSLIPDPTRQNAFTVHCINSGKTQPNNESLVQFCKIAQNAGMTITNINNPYIEYFIMQNRNHGCGAALVENVLLKMNEGKKYPSDKYGEQVSGHTKKLSTEDEDQYRIKHIENVLRNQSMIEPLIGKKQYPMILIPPHIKNPNDASISIVPTGEILERYCSGLSLHETNKTSCNSAGSKNEQHHDPEDRELPTIERINTTVKTQHGISTDLLKELTNLIEKLDKEIQANSTAFFRKFIPGYYDKDKILKEAKKFFLSKLKELLDDQNKSNTALNELIDESLANTLAQANFQDIDVYAGHPSRVAKLIDKMRITTNNQLKESAKNSSRPF